MFRDNWQVLIAQNNIWVTTKLDLSLTHFLSPQLLPTPLLIRFRNDRRRPFGLDIFSPEPWPPGWRWTTEKKFAICYISWWNLSKVFKFEWKKTDSLQRNLVDFLPLHGRSTMEQFILFLQVFAAHPPQSDLFPQPVFGNTIALVKRRNWKFAAR